MTDNPELIRNAVNRGLVAEQILSCTKCPLSSSCTRPVSFRGNTPNKLMILGEAPSRQDDKLGRPFVGPTGNKIDELLTDAGLPPLHDWFIANSISCYPHGAVTQAHLDACRANLAAQVQLANPKWVLTLGATPLRSIGIKEKITKLHGRPFEVLAGPLIGCWVFPTFHPTAGRNDPKVLTKISDDLRTMRSVVYGDASNLDAVKVRMGRGGRIVQGV